MQWMAILYTLTHKTTNSLTNDIINAKYAHRWTQPEINKQKPRIKQRDLRLYPNTKSDFSAELGQQMDSRNTEQRWILCFVKRVVKSTQPIRFKCEAALKHFSESYLCRFCYRGLQSEFLPFRDALKYWAKVDFRFLGDKKSIWGFIFVMLAVKSRKWRLLYL